MISSRSPQKYSRNQFRGDTGVQKTFTNTSKLVLKTDKSPKYYKRSGDSKESKLKQYMQSVKNMYEEQMLRIRQGPESVRFYDHIEGKKVIKRS